ncbi:hypothetical protein FXO37_27458 [Capsicum annuum]|nr:hypothetical protein FXO37_27458 [Capsicum annuum]
MGSDREAVLFFFGDLLYISEQDQGFTVKIACASSVYVIGLLILVQSVLQKFDYLGPGDYVSARYHPALNVVGMIVAGWDASPSQCWKPCLELYMSFFTVFVRLMSMDYGLLHMLCGFGYQFSLILDIFARDAITAVADSASGGGDLGSGLAVAEDRVIADEVHLVAPHANIDLPLPDLEIPHGFVGGRICWSEGGDF